MGQSWVDHGPIMVRPWIDHMSGAGSVRGRSWVGHGSSMGRLRVGRRAAGGTSTAMADWEKATLRRVITSYSDLSSGLSGIRTG